MRLVKVSFNPTMVRLLPTAKVLEFEAGVQFQSHNGAIAARQVVHH